MTMRNINRPLYLMGLTGMQVLVALLAVLLSFAIFNIGGLLTLLPIFILGKKIKKEQATGNPDYLSSLDVARQTRKYFRDDTNLMSRL